MGHGGTAHWCRGHPSPVRIDPRRARFVPVRRRRRQGPLRRQGEITPLPGQLVLPGPGQPGTPDGPDGGRRRPRRVDGGRHRGRGAPARAQPHPAVPAPLQRPPEGRQELSLVGAHGGGRVAEALGGARAQAQRGALLRSLPERGGHPRDARPAAPFVSGADLLGRQVPQPRAAGATVSALPHRAVLRSVRGGRVQGGVRPHGGRPGHVPGRRHRTPGAPSWSRACGKRRPRSTSSAPVRCATSSRPSVPRMPSARWSSTGPRTWTCWDWPRTSSRPQCRCSTSGRGGWWGARPSSSTRSRT